MSANQKELARKLLAQCSEKDDTRAKTHDDAIVFPGVHVAQESVLGCFMTTGLMETFHYHLHLTYKTCKRPEKIRVMFEPTNNVEINKRATAQIEEMITGARRKFVSDLEYTNHKGGRVSFPRRLDFRLDLCEEFTISELDRRVQLRGERGIRAKKYIPEYTVLGIYRGLILPRLVTDHTFVFSPMVGWEATVKDWENTVRRYMVETIGRLTNPATGVEENIELDISPYPYLSYGGLINDPHIVQTIPKYVLQSGLAPEYVKNGRRNADPFLNGEKVQFSTDNKMQVVAPDNTAVEVAYICGFPFPFVITTKPMLSGEELLYDYGRDFFLRTGHLLEAGDHRPMAMSRY